MSAFTSATHVRQFAANARTVVFVITALLALFVARGSAVGLFVLIAASHAALSLIDAASFRLASEFVRGKADLDGYERGAREAWTWRARRHAGQSSAQSSPPRAPQWRSVLGVPESASLTQCKTAYRTLAKALHPDNPETGDAEAFARLQDAWEQAKRFAK